MPTSHPQYTSLASALEHLRDVATHINEQKRIMDSMELALKVQERLTGDTPPPLVEAHRFVIREGLVLLQRPFTGKQSKEKREFTKYHFFLFNDLLLVTKIKRYNHYTLKVELPMETVAAGDIPDNECTAYTYTHPHCYALGLQYSSSSLSLSSSRWWW